MMMKKLYFFRKSHILGILTLLFLFAGFSMEAQQIISEHGLGILNENTAYKLHFDEGNYATVMNENGNKVFLKNQSSIQTTQPGEIARANVVLTINFVYDESEYYIPTVLIYDETGYMHTTTDQNFTNPLVISVPTGVYDILTEFQPINSGKTHIDIKEQQNIQENSTLQTNFNSSVNYVSITTYDENGEILEPESGVGGTIIFERHLYFNQLNTVIASDIYFEVDPFGGAGPTWNFYINDLSNRYSIIQTLRGAGYQQGNYFSKYETITGINASVALQNDPADWSYHEENFQPTQSAGFTIAPAYFAASTFNGDLMLGWMESAGGVINSGNADFRAFINNPLNGDPADLVIIPAIIDRYVPFSPTTGGINYFTKGSPIFSDGNGSVFYGSGSMMGDDYYAVNNGSVQLLPLNPRYSFDSSNNTSIMQGDNVPITVTAFKSTSNSFSLINKGRYGETRDSDYLNIQIAVKQNGTEIFSGAYQDFDTFNMPSNGEFEITLTNTNTLVEGMQGKNTTRIFYNADENDAPPTLQHLQFRNSENQVTQIFDTSVGASVRLSAGDFVYNMIDGPNGYYSYEAGNNVSLSYSVYNQNNWTDLPLTEYPEFFQMPAFGDYYDAPLEGIQNQVSNSWYDLKVICTDAAGNLQEQIISPAFKIDGTLGIQDITDTGFSVYPNPFSAQLNLKLPKNMSGNYTFKVTDLTGRIVYNKNQNKNVFSWDGSYLSQGVYILSIENAARSFTKKVIKL